ncbi:hypothetical protein CEUSTIGMA_g10435.t1 [Chlamydomonas eustigma]|uniref:Uncharacterized protein n=1 Tax=Chlamydomonas eustigma TaxID=1157962 RepID=A0A250XIV5_9CHLO|nr:hypothetical protein CEUSTIGMA_g10435.t1 [Chlamydomonas eustigma]|eukprot:GAX83008.1 hypothetical protein CEUSTIGMA_g10435.t1 [Chlamydomonas eustigma]
MAMTEKVVLVFHNDGGRSLLSGMEVEEFPGIEEALQTYVDVIKGQLIDLCKLREFRHVILQETEDEMKHEDAQSSLALSIGTAQQGADGHLSSTTKIRHPFDIQGLLTARSKILGPLCDKVAGNEEGVLEITDGALSKKVGRLAGRIKPSERMEAAVDEEAEEVLVDALAELAPEIEEGKEEEVLEPVHPMDLLTLILAYMCEHIGEPPSPPNAVQRLVNLGRDVFNSISRRMRSTRKVVWQMEDLAVGGARLALHVAKHSVRPLLIGFIANRALQTLERSRLPAIRMAKMSPAEQVDYYHTQLLGPDWREQMEQDFLEAVQEVEEGLNTDDYKDEKRKMTAAMLRQLEVEEWDKERMRHFYYGSYGLGPWYFDMEERLHNPYFIGARAWNGPIEGWVGKNKKYDDIPSGRVDLNTALLDLVEARKGVKLTPQQRDRIMQKQAINVKDMVESNPILNDVVTELRS